MKKIIAVLILTLLLQPSRAQKHFLRKLNTNTESSDAQFLCSARDSRGLIYLGSNQGLYLYDGNNCKLLLQENKKITALHYNQEKLYIGYEDGRIMIMQNGLFRSLKLHQDARINSEISQIQSTEQGNGLLITTKGAGVYYDNGHTTTRINSSNFLSDDYVYGCVQKGQIVWIANDRGINQINLNDLSLSPSSSIKNQRNLPDNIVSSIASSYQQKKIGLGFQSGYVAIQPSSSNKPLALFDNKEILGQVNHILFENDESLWAGGEQGNLILLQQIGDRLIIADSIQVGSIIQHLIKDDAGNILALCTNGLFEIVSPHISIIPAASQSIFPSAISALAQHFDSTIYYACQKTLFCFLLRQNKAVKVLEAPSIITKIFQEGDILWLGTLNSGVWHYHTAKKSLQQLSIGPLGKETHVIDMNCDQQHNLWIASLEGLYQCIRKVEKPYLPMQIVRYNKRDGLGSDYVHQIFTDSKGKVWFATDGAGPVFFNKGRFYNFKTDKHAALFKVVYAIQETSDGTIWCSSSVNGLFAFQQEAWHRYDKNYALNNQDYLGLSAMPNGRLIATQEDAILEYIPQQRFFRKYSPTSACAIDSLATNINLISQNLKGEILVPSKQGFLQIKPNYAFDQIAKIRIHKIQVFLKDAQWGKQLFDHDENQIGFEFENSNFCHSEKLFYRYRLKGLSEQWLTTNDKKITYSKLGPGHYSFEIQVSHNPNFDGAHTDQYSFEIRRAFWQQWWFYALVLATLAYVTRLYILRREKEIQKKESIQKEKLHFEFEHLKSQVNPHFLFNSLNTLVDLIDEDTERASDYTIHLAAMYRSLLAYRDKELIPIKEEIALLEHYIFVQRCRFGEALIIDIALEEQLAQKGLIVPLALQLLVENAIKHNEVSRAHPLLVSIYSQESYIVVHNQLKAKIKPEKGEGVGITNLQKRYQLLMQREIIIEKTNEYFIVKLPII